MGGKEKLTCDNFAAEASAYPTMELWSQDEPSELTRIETRDQAFIPTHFPLSFYYIWAVPRKKA